ncbi:hypothetical protein BH10BDE1_BH10BDE1_34150 [soil metagenome]
MDAGMTKRILKTHENRGLVLSMAAAALVAGLVGCGAPGSDPTAKYNDLNATAIPHKETARDQSVLETGAYSIEQEKDATIIEGETQAFKVYVRFGQKVDSYDLKLVGVPSDVSGMTLSKVAGEEGAFQINWAAPKGTVPATSEARQIPYRLELANVKSADGSVEALFRSVNRLKDFKFTVRRSGKRPEIVKVNEIPSEVAQGSIVPFTVDIMDPPSHEGFVPRLDIYFQGTNRTEGGYEANAATYVRTDSPPKSLGGGVWRFSYTFDAKNNDVGSQLDREGKRVDGATHLSARMYLKAYSASGGVSNERPVVLKIKYTNAQVANPKPLECPVPKPVAAVKATTAKATPAKATTVKK